MDSVERKIVYPPFSFFGPDQQPFGTFSCPATFTKITPASFFEKPEKIDAHPPCRKAAFVEKKNGVLIGVGVKSIRCKDFRISMGCDHIID
jgi:hypothetical protein